MTRRIFRSICTVAFVVFFTTLILVSTILYSHFSDTQQKQLKIQTNLVAQGVSALGNEYFNELTIDDIRITWIDQNGDVMLDTKAQHTNMENHIEREEVQEASSSGYKCTDKGSEVRFFDKVKAFEKLCDLIELERDSSESGLLSALALGAKALSGIGDDQGEL